MIKEYLMLDIGGTFVKCGCIRNGKFEKLDQFAICENGTTDLILSPIIDFLRAHTFKKAIISIPGPMDYPTGTSRMEHKFASLKGISIKKKIEDMIPQIEVSFVHDGVAFMLGEALYGQAFGKNKAASVMLGTGLGFAEWENGHVLVNKNLTPLSPIWKMPYRGSIAEQFVSARGIKLRWLSLGREDIEVKSIADLARKGDTDAVSLFADTGSMLGEILNEKLSDTEIVVIGGQISKSWDLMADTFQSACSIPAKATADSEATALLGAYAFGQKGMELLDIDQSEI